MKNLRTLKYLIREHQMTLKIDFILLLEKELEELIMNLESLLILNKLDY